MVNRNLKAGGGGRAVGGIECNFFFLLSYSFFLFFHHKTVVYSCMSSQKVVIQRLRDLPYETEMSCIL